jgi:hypothetical protein
MRDFIFVILLLEALLPFRASSEQILPDGLHSMPVLIEIPLADKIHSSYGTGVYLDESNKVFLVTAAHCLFDISSTNRLDLINSNAIISSLLAKGDTKDKNTFSLDLKRLMEEGLIKRHSNHDVAVVCLASMTKPDTNGTILDFWVNGVQALSKPEFILTTWEAKDVCVQFTNILDGNETYILGYPVELLNNQVALEGGEVDFGSPLIRKGVISQRNQQTGKLIIDSGVYGGNSGGPVLIVNHPSPGVTEFKVAGLITQFVPVSTRIFPQAGVINSVFVNSGYGVAEPIDYALELMRQY